MHKYVFFLETLRELECKTRPEASSFDLTKASGLLRQLFLDREPLAHSINRELRVPMVFRISAVEDAVSGNLPTPDLSFSSASSFDLPSKEVGLKLFLNHNTIAVSGHQYSVRNVIKCVAHVGGGVHYMPPEDDQEAALYKVASQWTIGNTSTLLHSVQDIANVALVGLGPLAHAARIAP